MPLIPNAMAAQVMGSVAGKTGGDLVMTLWQECCNYISANSLVNYAWAGMSATVPPTPDPVVVQMGSLVAIPKGPVIQSALTPCQDAASALSMLGTLMTSDEMGWIVKWQDPTFVAAAAITIPGVITLTPSGVSDYSQAINAFTQLCTQICDGIKTAVCTPATPGNHAGVYTGIATFTNIL